MPSPFTVALTGQSLIHHDIRGLAEPGFAPVVDTLKRADIVFTNFEGCINGSHGGWPLKGSYFGSSQPVVLDALKHIGFNALSLSNNHAFDLGPPGILSTLDEVRARGFLSAGIGVDGRDAATPGVGQLGGRKVALIAMDAGPGPDTMYADDAGGGRPARPGVNRLDARRIFHVNAKQFRTLTEIQQEFQSSVLERANYAQPHDPPVTASGELDFWGTIFREASTPYRQIAIDEASAARQLQAIAIAAAGGAFVVAYLHQHHWEPSWQDVPQWVTHFARRCVDAGARAFVAHGAPVLQAIEVYHGAPLFYGLGNFFFHLREGQSEWSPPEVWKSVIATCRFDDDDQLLSMDLLPIVLGGEERLNGTAYHERILPLAAGRDLGQLIIEDIRLRSAAYGTHIESKGTVARVMSERPGS